MEKPNNVREVAKQNVEKEIAKAKGIPLEEAIRLFERSKTCALLMSPKSALWKEPYDYIFEKFEYEEQKNWTKWKR